MNYNIKNRKLSLKEVQKILIKFKLGLHAFANIVQPDDQQKQNCISSGSYSKKPLHIFYSA